MRRVPAAEEFLSKKSCGKYSRNEVITAMRDFARAHVSVALEEALEEVPYGGSDPVRYRDVVGILKCYPPEIIK